MLYDRQIVTTNLRFRQIKTINRINVIKEKFLKIFNEIPKTLTFESVFHYAPDIKSF